jgi:hypothetical protein
MAEQTIHVTNPEAEDAPAAAPHAGGFTPQIRGTPWTRTGSGPDCS